MAELIKFENLPGSEEKARDVFVDLGKGTVFASEVDPVALGIGVVPEGAIQQVIESAPVVWQILNNAMVDLLVQDEEFAQLCGLSSDDIQRLASSGRFEAQLSNPLMFETDCLNGGEAFVANEINATPRVGGFASHILTSILGSAPAEWKVGTSDLDAVLGQFLLDQMPEGTDTVIILEGVSTYESIYHQSNIHLAESIRSLCDGAVHVQVISGLDLDSGPTTDKSIGVVYNTVTDGGLSIIYNDFIAKMIDGGVCVVHSFPAASIRTSASLVHSSRYSEYVSQALGEAGFEAADWDKAKSIIPPLDIFFMGNVDTSNGLITTPAETMGYLMQPGYIEGHWFKFTVGGNPKVGFGEGLPGETTHLYNGAVLNEDEKMLLAKLLCGNLTSVVDSPINGVYARKLKNLASLLDVSPDIAWSCVSQPTLKHHQLGSGIPFLDSDGDLNYIDGAQGMLRLYLWGLNDAVVPGLELFIGSTPPIKATSQAAAPARCV